MSPPLVVVRGSSPIVLIAPHAGRRDAARRPWGSAPLKMNDLHTGSLTLELARRLDAAAIVNDGGDRNDVDLARISAAHDHAPQFLDAFARLLDETIARHGRAVVLTIHGWNVVQPAVDLGVGIVPDGAPFQVSRDAAVSDAFAATTLRALMAALSARGIAATPGLRYPARARENLLQLFTPRHVHDARPLVRRLAAHGDAVDAVQLELALPLRIPGPWREAFVDACAAAFTVGEELPEPPPWVTPVAAARRATLEFVADRLSGLAALDALGARLLLFLDDGALVTFTGERVGVHGPTNVAGLRMEETGSVLDLAYDGPMLRFPDTMPFLDLESGLAGAAVIEASVHLRFTSAHDGADGPCPFGVVEGDARLDGVVYEVRGHGARVHRAPRPGLRPRAALRGADDSFLLDGAGGSFVCRGGRHGSLTHTEIALAGTRVHVRAEHDDGTVLSLEAELGHRLPVVRGGLPAGRLLFAVCRNGIGLGGWVELPDH